MDESDAVKQFFLQAERLCNYEYLHWKEVKKTFDCATPLLEKLLEPEELRDIAITVGLLVCKEDLGAKSRSDDVLAVEREGIKRIKEIIQKYRTHYK